MRTNSFRWQKMGLLIEPSPKFSWLKTHAGPSFVDTTTNPAKIYVTGRDELNRSHIGVFNLLVGQDGLRVDLNSGRLLFSPGDLGTFDESGVSYPWLVHVGKRIFMYYVGWTAGGLTKFQNFTGLAISDDGGTTFKRFGQVPILDRTKMEPFGSGSCAVWLEQSGWKMFYTSFEPWSFVDGSVRPTYRLKEATSIDGINWDRVGKVVLDFKDSKEHIIGKPMIIKEAGRMQLWYSYRGNAYRIGYAESEDGISFERRDELVGIDVSSSGWDSEMIEYAFVFDLEGIRYMIYNGNNFGKTGLGYAILKL
jgi:hypothetical protein